MRYLVLLVFGVSFLLLSGALRAQGSSILVLTAKVEGADEKEGLKLRQELQAIFNDVLLAETYGSLGCRFKMRKVSSQRISGMAKRTIAKFEFTLTYSDYALEIPVGSPVNGTISGVGGNESEAVSNALQKLVNSHLSANQLRQIIEEHRRQFSDCGTLLNMIQALSGEKKNMAVLAVYAQLSGDGQCDSEFEEIVNEVYEQQQAANCQQLIIQAKAEVVLGNRRKAALLLGGVDPTLNCSEEVEALLDTLMEKDFIGPELQWYQSARQTAILSSATRRRIISNLVLEYAYRNY